MWGVVGDQGPVLRHTIGNFWDVPIAFSGSKRNSARSATTVWSVTPSSLRLLFLTKASHCLAFCASRENSSVSARGVSVGTSVRLRSNVALIASHRRSPLKSKCRASFHRS